MWIHVTPPSTQYADVNTVKSRIQCTMRCTIPAGGRSRSLGKPGRQHKHYSDEYSRAPLTQNAATPTHWEEIANSSFPRHRHINVDYVRDTYSWLWLLSQLGENKKKWHCLEMFGSIANCKCQLERRYETDASLLTVKEGSGSKILNLLGFMWELDY